MNRSNSGVAVNEGGQPLAQLSLRQIRGMADLVHDVVAGSVDAVEKTHRSIARTPFAVLEQISTIAAPVRLIEHFERTISDGVYQSIRLGNRLAAAAATQVLDWSEETERLKAKGTRRKAQG